LLDYRCILTFTNAKDFARSKIEIQKSKIPMWVASVPDSLVINEIYLSLQGESTFTGLPCVFVRLTACDLRCSYCDSAFAFTEGKKRSIDEICSEVARLAAPFQQRNIVSEVTRMRSSSGQVFEPPHVVCFGLPLVELTGGEPLLQKNSLQLMKRLCDDGYVVLLETSGAHDISVVDSRVRRIVDLKCPSSGEVGRNRWQNLRHLRGTDEIKFVVGTEEDYEWAKQQIAEHKLESTCPLLMSWVQPLTTTQLDRSLKQVPPNQTPVSRRQLAEMIVADALPVRFQLQMHKVLWSPDKRKV
jgi:7-carboxy-7-deazaguanine synthase